MKRIMMISMLAVLTAVPSMAQYVRRPYPRPVAPYQHRRNYTAEPHRHSGIDSYFGLRIGFGVTNISADEHYLDGSSPKAGEGVSK